MSLAQLLNPAPRGDARDDDARSIDIGSQDSESICSGEEYTDQDDGDSGHGYYSEEDGEAGRAESFIDDGPAQSFMDDGERITEEGEGAAREHRSAPPQLSGTLVDRWRERAAQSSAPPQPWAPRADAFVAVGAQPGPSSRHEAVERWIAEREAAADGGGTSEAGYCSAPEQARGVREEERVTGRDKGKGKAHAPPRPWGSVRAESFEKGSAEPEPESMYHRPPPPPWLAGREATPDAPESCVPISPEARAALPSTAPQIKVRRPSPEAGRSVTLGVGDSIPPKVECDVSESGGSSGSSPLIDVARARRTSVGVSTFTKDGQRSPCKFCDKTFNRPTDALRHMKTVHEDPEDGEWTQLNTCCVCGKRLARPDSLKRHCDARHGGAGPPPKRRRGESASGSAGSMV